ncbi:MAG: hypothetical protein QM753_09850 [Thermomicrobiales bacterium]
MTVHRPVAPRTAGWVAFVGGEVDHSLGPEGGQRAVHLGFNLGQGGSGMGGPPGGKVGGQDSRIKRRRHAGTSSRNDEASP